MIPTIQTLILLLIVIAAVAVAAARLKIPAAILLVLTGVVLGLIPGLPTVELAPELVLLLVLQPIIYSSAVAMSWREFRFNLRPISLLALGCVVFTTVATAAAAHFVLSLPWPIGFVLGAIVSPPDAVAPLSVARRMQLPGASSSCLEGEAWRTMRRRWCSIASPWPQSASACFPWARPRTVFAAIVAGEVWGLLSAGSCCACRWVGDPASRSLCRS